MKNINDLMNKIASSIENSEDSKIALSEEKKNIIEKNEELKKSTSVLEDAINEVKNRKIKINITVFIIIGLIYALLLIFTNILEPTAIKVISLILALDIMVQMSSLINKTISNSVAKEYNYIDFYSLYQQYNMLKRDVKSNNIKISEIEIRIDEENSEISRLVNIKDNIDIILNDDNSKETLGSSLIHNSLEKKYSSIL